MLFSKNRLPSSPYNNSTLSSHRTERKRKNDISNDGVISGVLLIYLPASVRRTGDRRVPLYGVLPGAGGDTRHTTATARHDVPERRALQEPVRLSRLARRRSHQWHRMLLRHLHAALEPASLRRRFMRLSVSRVP